MADRDIINERNNEKKKNDKNELIISEMEKIIAEYRKMSESYKEKAANDEIIKSKYKELVANYEKSIALQTDTIKRQNEKIASLEGIIERQTEIMTIQKKVNEICYDYIKALSEGKPTAKPEEILKLFEKR